MTMDGNIYLLQYGSYISKNVLEENIKKLDDYIIVEEDNKYYVYIGAFTSLSNAKLLQEMFNNQNIYTYIKNDYIGNNEVMEEIKKLDKEIIKNEDKIVINNKKILEILKKI
jgi:hypothetical protein